MYKKLLPTPPNNSNNDVNDCVVFMTNYSITKYQNGIFKSLNKKIKLKSLMDKYHIDAVVLENFIRLDDIRINYEKEYDSISQKTIFRFDKTIDAFDNEIKSKLDHLQWTISLFHSIGSLLDSNLMKIDMIFSMKSFLISTNNSIYQVDPIIYTINGDLFILYELIDFTSGLPIKHNDIFGRENNFNIVNVNWYQYFNEDRIEKSIKISDIIFNNIIDFISNISKIKYAPREYSFVHNILVLSNRIKNKNNYFLQVLGNNNVELTLNNINTSDAFEYYTEPYLGVVTNIDKKEFSYILYDAIILESLKMNIYLNSIISFETENKLSKTIDRRVYYELLLNILDAPIITCNLIQQIKNHELFKQRQEALDYKIKYLDYIQEKKRVKNTTLLNILIYVMTFIGCIGTLEVLDNEFGWPFKFTFIIISLIYVIFGTVWVYYELKE